MNEKKIRGGIERREPPQSPLLNNLREQKIADMINRGDPTEAADLLEVKIVGAEVETTEEQRISIHEELLRRINIGSTAQYHSSLADYFTVFPDRKMDVDFTVEECTEIKRALFERMDSTLHYHSFHKYLMLVKAALVLFPELEDKIETHKASPGYNLEYIKGGNIKMHGAFLYNEILHAHEMLNENYAASSAVDCVETLTDKRLNTYRGDHTDKEVLPGLQHHTHALCRAIVEKARSNINVVGPGRLFETLYKFHRIGIDVSALVKPEDFAEFTDDDMKVLGINPDIKKISSISKRNHSN